MLRSKYLYKKTPLRIQSGMNSKHLERGASEKLIFLAVPIQLKTVAQPVEALIRSGQKARSFVRGGGAIDYAAGERTTEEEAADIKRAVHADILSALDVHAPRVWIYGRTYRRIFVSSPGTYYTMTGPVVVNRALYQEEGIRNAPAVDAISVRAGMFDRGWLPKTAQAMAHQVQQGTS